MVENWNSHAFLVQLLPIAKSLYPYCTRIGHPTYIAIRYPDFFPDIEAIGNFNFQSFVNKEKVGACCRRGTLYCNARTKYNGIVSFLEGFFLPARE